uniref:Secreted protein n=1 Tax=Rhipicephalus appendiculatus TaxID=34631 RepID=A0A131YBN3_RHIAP
MNLLLLHNWFLILCFSRLSPSKRRRRRPTESKNLHVKINPGFLAICESEAAVFERYKLRCVPLTTDIPRMVPPCMLRLLICKS